jgi:hypothetical protein
MSKQAAGIVARAKKEIGAKEGENNDTKYGIWYGLNHQPWCGMFVSWIFSTEKILPLIAETPHGYASCPSFEAWAKAQRLIVPINKIEAGDILLFDFSGKGIAEHTGIATGSYDLHSHLVPTIEGNTSGDHTGSQPNGDGVYAKVRPLSCIRTVVRPRYAN